MGHSSTTETTTTVHVGDIFQCTWGYDQTNIDFYQVVGISASGQSATLCAIEAELVEVGNRRLVAPKSGHFTTGRRFSRKIQSGAEWGGSVWMRMTSYSSLQPWNGQPQYDTNAAGDIGH